MRCLTLASCVLVLSCSKPASPLRAASEDVAADSATAAVTDAGSDAVLLVEAVALDASPGELAVEVGGADIGPDAVALGGPIGSACTLDNQCTLVAGVNEATCLDWTGGYCTYLGCPNVSACPADAACVVITGGQSGCLATCDASRPCRDGYGCKPFTTADTGASASVCVMVTASAGPLGGACKDHPDCGGAASCLTFIPGGYCAVVGCSPDTPCPDGGTCVKYNGSATCLRGCTKAAECEVGGAKDRQCSALLTPDETVATVCLPASQGGGVGSGCKADLDCKSGQCQIVATGKCVGSELGCFEDGDCANAGVCEKAPAYVKGLCAQACTAAIGCPGTSLCLDVSPPSGIAVPSFCHVSCKGASDQSTCDDTVGEVCVFGDPVVDTSGQGKYACVALKAGDPGNACKKDSDCKSGGCLAGLCAPACGSKGQCPFPTTCTSVSGVDRCVKRCLSLVDCPATATCAALGGGKVCGP